jgi:predicted outer membrane protein
MHHRPSGHRLLPLLLRWSRRGRRRAGLPVSAVVALVAVTIMLATPAPEGAAESAPTLDAVEASADTTLAHAGDDPTGIGVPMERVEQTAIEAAEPSDADGAPLAVSDREVLHKVKQAGLWEMPVGTWLTERAVDPLVREVGGKISAEHHELDGIVEEAAARLGVALPTDPTAEQQGWMREIDAQQGAAFDERAVFLLRQAHGNVLPFLTQVRVSTRSAEIREFTTEAMAFVQRHIEYLESTGLVDYELLPSPSDVDHPDWLANTLDFLLYTLVTALFVVLLVLFGRALARTVQTLAGPRESRTTTPRARAHGHHARSRA